MALCEGKGSIKLGAPGLELSGYVRQHRGWLEQVCIISIWRAEIITLPEGLEWREPGRVILCKVPGPCTVRH